MKLVSLHNVSVSYEGIPALRDVTLDLFSDDFTGIIGPNGGGKTTLVKAILGMVPYSGRIEFADGISVHDGTIGYLPQQNNFDRQFPISVAEVVYSGLQSRKRLVFRISSDERKKADELMAMAGIAPLSGKPIGAISGGEMQRALLCRALISDPKLLILDEPTNHLDMRSKDVLKEAIREFDGTVILVSHDRDFLDGLATKVYEFGGGLVKEHLGGIYEFLQKKKIDSLNELQKGAGLSASPTASAKGNEPETVQPSENKLSYEAQKELNKKIKKLERQVADCEASIEETESAIAIVEAKMATPEGASDMQLYERHQKLKQQLDGIVEEWERVSMELEETKN